MLGRKIVKRLATRPESAGSIRTYTQILAEGEERTKLVLQEVKRSSNVSPRGQEPAISMHLSKYHAPCT